MIPDSVVKEFTTVSFTTSDCPYPPHQDNHNRSSREHGQQPAENGEQATGPLGFLRYNDQCLFETYKNRIADHLMVRELEERGA